LNGFESGGFGEGQVQSVSCGVSHGKKKGQVRENPKKGKQIGAQNAICVLGGCLSIGKKPKTV